MRKPIFIILIALGFILPILAYAALVPCGRCCDTWNEDRTVCNVPCDDVSPEEAQPCTLCDIFRMLQIIMNYIWWFLLIIAPLFIIAGGVMILTAGVKPDQLDSGKRIITGTIIGLAIAFLSWTILNITFNALAEQETEGFPWPWYEIRCTGGEIKEQQIYEEEAFGGNRYCHLQIANAPDEMVEDYGTAEACYQSCAPRCIQRGTTCESWCCLDQDRDEGINVCGAYVDPGWCRRTVPVNALSWTLSSYPDPRQRGDASILLSGFIDCMFLRVPYLQINSISSNVLCITPSCDTSTPNCGHAANSCHFGGTNCRGQSYAVDFNTNVACRTIASAAEDCNPNSWFNYEMNHVHISVNNSACGCNEGIYGADCP